MNVTWLHTDEEREDFRTSEIDDAIVMRFDDDETGATLVLEFGEAEANMLLWELRDHLEALWAEGVPDADPDPDDADAVVT